MTIIYVLILVAIMLLILLGLALCKIASLADQEAERQINNTIKLRNIESRVLELKCSTGALLESVKNITDEYRNEVLND